MAQTLWSDISSLANNIQEGALFTLRATNVLAATVKTWPNATSLGMNPRTGYDWGSGNFRQVGEADDVVGTNLAKTLRSTLTPARYADQIFVSDARSMSDWEDIRSAAVMEQGEDAANQVDTDIASNFSSLTGGTIGTAGGTLTWTNIIAGVATLRQASVPGMYTCALGEGHWFHLLNDVTVDAAAFANAPSIVEGMASRYYTTPMLAGVVFAVTANITGGAGTAGYGAVYSQLALAYDERKGFNVRPQRDESREGEELNTSMWYAHGTWAPARGVALLGTDVIPSS